MLGCPKIIDPLNRFQWWSSIFFDGREIKHRDEALRNGYLYQIYTYLRSQERVGDPIAENSTGLILHPAVGYSFKESVVIQNHEIRFATVDLGATAKEIRDQLLKVVGAEL